MSEPRKIRLVMDEMTLGDLVEFEDATGMDLFEELAPKPVLDPKTRKPLVDPASDKGEPLMVSKPSTRAILGMIWLMDHKDNPNLTYADVMAYRLGDIDFEYVDSAEPDPTEGEQPDESNG